MNFDFDTEIDRRGTDSLKWEFVMVDKKAVPASQAISNDSGACLLPMWVADMDFRCPPAVIEAVTDRARQGVYGYSEPANSYFEAVINWMSRRQKWQIKQEWIVMTPGVVPALNMLVQTFVAPGEKVVIQPPVYYPFFHAIENNGAQIVPNELKLENGRYQIDFDDLTRKAADPAVKMLILCSPHNPVGRVWTRAELTMLGEICLENDVLLVADEIHGDLIYSHVDFTPFATINDTFTQNSIICTAPSKSFNLAGLKTSNIIIPNGKLRKRFSKTIERNGIARTNAFGVIAAEAAYNHGEPWLQAVMAYIEENYRFMAAYLEEHLPQLTPIQPEGTYLVWVDCRKLELDAAARKALFMQNARVYLDEGEMFGSAGAGFERFNLACPRTILVEALERIETAVSILLIAENNNWQ